MYDIPMRLLNANLTFVHSALEEYVSKTANGIRIAKEAEVAQDCSLMINAVYYGENRHQVEESGHWCSRPTLKLQGDLLGICGELVYLSDWHRVKCILVAEQAVHINDWNIAVGPWEKELVLLDTDPALARRDYPPAIWRVPWNIADGMIFPFYTPLDAWIVVGVKITVDVDLKGLHSFLYVSSRCDSPEFAVELSDAYKLEWRPDEE